MAIVKFEGGGAQQRSPRPEAIPQHTWDLLQQAGEQAAQLLLDILESPKFKSFKPSDQKALIDMALTRAYGLPIRREVSVNLSSSDTDAVAASIAALGDSLTLPERRRARQQRTISPEDDT